MANRPMTIGAARPRVRGTADVIVRQRGGTTNERGYGSDWQRARALYLAEHPLCAHCDARGLTVPANEVDHRVPIERRPDLRMVESNWQALCKPCHSRKTATELNASRRTK